MPRTCYFPYTLKIEVIIVPDIAAKAQKVRDDGARRRKTRTPKEGSWRLRVYRWWQKQSGKYRERDNFCHFMRVVFLWAPLRWVAKPLLLALAAVAAIALIWVAVLFYQAVLPVAGVVAGVILVFSASTFAHLIATDEEFREEWQDRTESWPKALRGLLQAILFPFIFLWKGVDRFVQWLVRLHDDYDLYGRVGRWLGETKFSNNTWFSWIRPWLIFPLTLVVLAVYYTWALVLLSVIVGLAVLLGIAVLFSYFGERADIAIAERRERQHRAEIDRTLRVIYGVIHPRYANSDARYAEWLQRYIRFCRRRWCGDVYDATVSWHIDHVESRRHIQTIYSRLNLPLPPRYWLEARKKRLQRSLGSMAIAGANSQQTSRWRRMWRTVRDGLRLVWAYVLAMKWRTCHFVEIPDERQAV